MYVNFSPMLLLYNENLHCDAKLCESLPRFKQAAICATASPLLACTWQESHLYQ